MGNIFTWTYAFSYNQTLHEQQQNYYRDIIFDVDGNDDRTIESDGEAETSSEGIRLLCGIYDLHYCCF